MASIVFKTKKGREYAYWVRSARVHGKPRIVEQVYLGPKGRFVDEIKVAYSRGLSPGPTPLKRLRDKEFGASALLWHWAKELDLVGIVDRHVPAVPTRRRTTFSVGQYLVMAAINRAVNPCSKRAFHDWYRESVLSRLWPGREGELSSQRFWDHMDQVQTEHIEAIQHDLIGRLAVLFNLGQDTVLYDSTNFFTFIDTFNDRSQLAQRGHNKQKRHDLRQLSLALFEDCTTSLPLYHQCYAGNHNDVTQFPFAWENLLKGWLDPLEREPEQLTLVFDRGNTSRANVQQLDRKAVHYVAGVPQSWMRDLLDVPRTEYRDAGLPGAQHVRVYRARREVWGKERTVLVVLSPSFYRRQRAAMNREQEKAERNLQELAAAIDRWATRHRGKGYDEAGVRRKVATWTAREHLRQFLDLQLEVEQGRVVRLEWTWNATKKREIQRRHLGKQILVTDRADWDDATVVAAYRRLTRTESLFRITKSRPGLWWPMFHWTDSKIRVHALYCYFALLLLAIMRLQLRQAGLSYDTDTALAHLRRIRETAVVYTNGAADRVLSDMDETQENVADALQVLDLAREMGNTLLPRP